MGQSRVATGNVSPCRFIKLATTADGQATQCGAGDQIFGISGPSTRQAPYPGLDDGYHAIAGENIAVREYPERDVLLELSGTVSPGDRLKADTNGTGIVTTSANDEIGAIAKAAGVSGDRIPVDPLPPMRY